MMKRAGITLMYDPDTGEGYIKESKDFKKESILMQLDCLKDWLYDLEILYDKHHKDYFSRPPKKGGL
jgi:hypothetical protein|tara:strand:+ start:119 stop:319 length:201 start_codon:yes stop_codon:yes gene_type:complete